MKIFSLGLCFLLFLPLFLSCERENFDDEIRETFREAKRDSTSGVVIDGNMWSALSSSSLTWDEADRYCRNLSEAGHYDWRLPTIDELRTLIQNCPQNESGGACNQTDECLSDAECSRDYDNCQCCDSRHDLEGYYSKLGDNFVSLWSSIRIASNPIRTHIVDFGRGCITNAVSEDAGVYTVEYKYARCVR